MSSCNRMLKGREITPKLKAATMSAMSVWWRSCKKQRMIVEIEREVFGRTWPSGQSRDKHFSSWTTFYRKFSPLQNPSFYVSTEIYRIFVAIESIKFLHITLILFLIGLCGAMWQWIWIKSFKREGPRTWDFLKVLIRLRMWIAIS